MPERAEQPAVAGSRLTALLLVVAAGCGGGADAPAVDTVVRDSGGVRIVENHGTPVELAITDAPVIQIGAVEGAEADQLHQVRSVARLLDGTVVVADGGSNQLRFYDEDGAHIRSVGRRGAGPGEFQAISFMRRIHGDSLLVYDSRNRRITVVAPDGVHGRDFVPRTATGAAAPAVAALEDATLLVRGIVNLTPDSRDYVRDTLTYAVVPEDGTATDLPRYAGAEMQRTVDRRGGDLIAVSMITLPYARTTHATAAGTRFYLGSSDSYEVHAYDGTGRLLIVIRSAHAPVRPVDGDAMERYIAAELERRARTTAARAGAEPFDAVAARRQIEAQPRMATIPTYSALVGAEDGSVWVREYGLPGADRAPSRWAVHAPDGALLRFVTLPAGFQPRYIDDTLILGTTRDELDVEYIRGYRVPNR